MKLNSNNLFIMNILIILFLSSSYITQSNFSSTIPNTIPRCYCTWIYQPVCSKNKKTFDNSCLLRCEGEIFDYDGKCKSTISNCNCTYEYKPVCGLNKNTYANMCLLNCAGIVLDYEGQCCNCSGINS